MSKNKSLFITVISNLKIQEDLGEGIELWDKIRITNNKIVITSLLAPGLEDAIGGLETTALEKAEAIFYSVDHLNINSKNEDEILCNYLANCKIFLNDLWLLKDHCADLMMGYINYPYISKELVLHLPAMINYTHSNFITGGFTDAGGKHMSSTQFTKGELEQAKSYFDGKNRSLIPFAESSVKSSFLEKGAARLMIASVLTQTARIQHDLGLKISQYCTALEALFTTDNLELSHKLSERVAYFLEDKPSLRKEIYKQCKEIYSVRSNVVHGSTIKKFNSLPTISKQADEILRRTFNKIHDNPELDKYFRKDNSDVFEEYMADLVFGVGGKEGTDNYNNPASTATEFKVI
jgi:hypothetical protein